MSTRGRPDALSSLSTSTGVELLERLREPASVYKSAPRLLADDATMTRADAIAIAASESSAPRSSSEVAAPCWAK